MKFPFSTEQFLGVFDRYNNALEPIQVIMIVLALFAITFSIRRNRSSHYVIPLILSFLWLWMGTVYHFVYFATINKAAYLFGSLFILQSILFIVYGFYKNTIVFRFRGDVYGIIGLIFVLYALIGYPIAGYTQNHIYPQLPTFGLPCPTAIFTFGILLWSTSKIPSVLLTIPLLWTFIGFSAALNFGMIEDFGLLVAGVVSSALIFIRNHKMKYYTLRGIYHP